MKKNLSPVFIFLTLLFLAGISCKKSSHASSDSNKYYIRLKINGAQQELTYNAGAGPAVQEASSGVYSFALVAAKDANNSGNNLIDVNLYAATAINSAGSFQDPQVAASSWPQIIITYIDEHSEAYTSMGLAAALGIADDLGVIADAKSTITEMTAKEVKGNFSATVYSGDYQKT